MSRGLGQDYFFDTKAQPDNAARMAEFIDSFNKAGQEVYQKAQEAQVLFGLANNLGPLPGLGWFTARAAAAGMAKNEDDVEAFSTGGVVYASKGMLVNYEPKGTDTIPAMLTPGEFVVNKASTQANLPLLQSINSGQYNKGGRISYLADGTPGVDAFNKQMILLTEILKISADNLQISFTNIIDKLNNFNIPEQNSGGVS